MWLGVKIVDAKGNLQGRAMMNTDRVMFLFEQSDTIVQVVPGNVYIQADFDQIAIQGLNASPPPPESHDS